MYILVHLHHLPLQVGSSPNLKRSYLTTKPPQKKKGLSRRVAAMLKAKSSENFPALSKAQPRPVSSSYQSYASVASGRASALQGAVSPYLAMVLDPQSKDKAARYPDETIVPTGLVHLASQSTYTVPTGTTTLITMLRWKCDIDDPSTGANTAPINLPSSAFSGTWNDYGSSQASWADISSIDRTLACGIRVRVVGLPTATYLPSGTLYFLQLQQNENALSYSTSEQNAIQAVMAGKGFSCTVNELSKTDGVTLPFLPQGPMSFVFSDTNSEPAAIAGSGISAPPTVVSANGYVAVVAFGLQEGTVFRFDYAHHIEYIPSVKAAGLVATKVEPPSSAARDAISRGAQAIQKSLAGSSNIGSIAGLVTGGGVSALSAITKAAVGMIPGASTAVSMAKMAADGLGAPAWVKSALGFLG